MKKYALVLLAAGLLSCGNTPPVDTGYDWPRWRGPDGDGVSKETDWNPKALETLRVSWKADVGTGYSNVAIKGGRLYTAGLKEGTTVVSCLRADTGKAIWEHSVDSTGLPQATPSTDGKAVYILAGNGLLASLDASNGRLLWEKDLVSGYGATKPFYSFAGSPVIEGDLLMLAANTSGIALKWATGELAWTSARPPKVGYSGGTSKGVDYASPVIYEHGGRRCALFCSFEGLHAVDVKTGEVAWVYGWADTYDDIMGVVSDPVLVDGTVFLTQYRAKALGAALIDISGKTPRLIWSHPEMSSQTGNHVKMGDFLYVCNGGQENNDASIRCLEAHTGRICWERVLDEGKHEPAVTLGAAGGKLIIISDRGVLAVAEASPEGYREIARADVGKLGMPGNRFWTPPVLCNGRIYCRGYLGDLVCIDVRK